MFRLLRRRRDAETWILKHFTEVTLADLIAGISSGPTSHTIWVRIR